jgi:hypothetical protein
MGMVEMIAEFDPVIQEHVRHITIDETHIHYLGHGIQNEIINLLATAIRYELIMKIKESKYFSVILDCTPDASHQEQLSLIIRYVDTSLDSICIEESFLGFLDVNDTTGQGLFDVLQNELQNLGLDIDNVRGQGYDNGSNMKGKNQGVQKKLLDINPRAFYSACGCHSLNLTLCVGTLKTGYPPHISSKSKQGAGHASTHCHASYSFGPHLPVEVGSGAAMCPTAPDLTSLLR